LNYPKHLVSPPAPWKNRSQNCEKKAACVASAPPGADAGKRLRRVKRNDVKKEKTLKTIETLTHQEASRKNIPTAEYQSVMRKDEETPIQIAYKRRNRDLNPHRNYELRDPIEVRVLPSSIEIISYSGIDPSLTQSDFEKGVVRTRRYRNRQIGSFLKELGLTEGKGTGIPIRNVDELTSSSRRTDLGRICSISDHKS